MQEKMQKKSPIKWRILQFADSLNISRRKFYELTSISRGTLEANTGITEDIMSKVIATFEDLSPEWLITGRGPMLRPKAAAPSQAAAPQQQQTEDISIVNAQRETISALRDTVEALKETVQVQQELIKALHPK